MTDARKRTTIIIMSLMVLAGIVISFFLGQFSITPKELGGIIISQFADIKPFWTSQQEHVFWTVRMPRILIACIVGIALSTAGCVYQGVFENPMAAPDFLGASSGAGLGAALAILAGMNEWMITVMAFVFSLATIWLVYIIGNRTRGNKTVGLVLAGLMVSALAQAGTSFIKLVADQTNELPEITYWLMGSLTGTTQRDVVFSGAIIVVGIIPLLILRWKINVLTIGEDEASTIGINVARVRFISLICATLVTAAAVSVSGMIGWVGLVVPHFCRKIVGNNMKFLLPASVFMGAFFLLMVDNISRNLFAVEIPIGILTAIIGAPFFIYLITKGGESV
ncbi:MAG: iron ABC transporter permease [Mogibacterium sp.]|nr:iron ABC transporter permease [Mogibacterium sp.]